MQFTTMLDSASSAGVAQFIKVMGASRDFYFWGDKLIAEETAELDKAVKENEGMAQVFKELADLSYVMIGCYLLMPANPRILLNEEMDARLELVFTEAHSIGAAVVNQFNISADELNAAIAIVQASNMSKLDDEGKPIISDGTDGKPKGKVLKGPNYVAPDMQPVVDAYMQRVQEAADATSARH